MLRAISHRFTNAITQSNFAIKAIYPPKNKFGRIQNKGNVGVNVISTRKIRGKKLVDTGKRWFNASRPFNNCNAEPVKNQLPILPTKFDIGNQYPSLPGSYRKFLSRRNGVLSSSWKNGPVLSHLTKQTPVLLTLLSVARFATTITPNPSPPPPPPSTTPTLPIFRVKKLSEHAVIPSRGSNGAAGYDLHAAYDAVVPKRGKALVKTDLAMIIDPSVYGRIAPRSGLAWKHSIDVGAGVIDSDYRGNIGIVLFNHGDDDFIIGKGDRVAQLIFEKIQMVGFAEVDDELEETNRASGGFGSTGK